MPAPISHTPTGIYPAWIPADQFTPDTPRLVLCTDGEGTFIGVYEASPYLPGEWINAATEDPFDSIITHWMECPPAPES